MGSVFRLDGQVAVVTGAANGIGLATAKMLSEAGARVGLLDLNIEQAQAAVNDLGADPAQAFALAADVSDEAQVEEAMASIAKRADKIDILVNCAGIALRHSAMEHPMKDWDAVMSVNMTGSFLTARAAVRHMPETGGAIVHTASIMGLSGGGLYPNISYQTTKGAIVNMTRALAVEWAGSNIRVNAVAPTYVRTKFIQALLDQPELIAKIESLTPLGRLAEPEEVAAAILFLASPAAAMITGHTLPVDGGYLAQ